MHPRRLGEPRRAVVQHRPAAGRRARGARRRLGRGLLEVYDGLGALPPFNPDVETGGNLPGAVVGLRARIGVAGALLLSVPEYAHGMPGAFKNLLDWLVGGPEFVDKPIALWNASPRATHAQASLRETVTTMSGRLVEVAALEIGLLGRDAEAVIREEGVAEGLSGALEALATAV